jgi:hypothetical protein
LIFTGSTVMKRTTTIPWKPRAALTISQGFIIAAREGFSVSWPISRGQSSARSSAGLRD